MNERIQELAEQAKEYADGYGDRYDAIWFQIYNEKFTELIVRGCAKEAAYWWPADYYGAKTVEDRILQHFGVEE